MPTKKTICRKHIKSAIAQYGLFQAASGDELYHEVLGEAST
jgi:hypothetical protein